MDGNPRFEICTLALVVDVIDKGRKVKMKQLSTEVLCP
jgi:hypothetical protein